METIEMDKVMNMSKAKLIKKDSPKQEELKMRRKTRRQRNQVVTPTRNAIQMTTDWLKTKRVETVNARDAFAALFSEADPQSV
jgi:protein subunit release factor B